MSSLFRLRNILHKLYNRLIKRHLKSLAHFFSKQTMHSDICHWLTGHQKRSTDHNNIQCQTLSRQKTRPRYITWHKKHHCFLYKFNNTKLSRAYIFLDRTKTAVLHFNFLNKQLHIYGRKNCKITIALKYQTKRITNFGNILHVYDKFKMQTELNLSLNDHKSFKFQLRAPTINIHLSPSITMLTPPNTHLEWGFNPSANINTHVARGFRANTNQSPNRYNNQCTTHVH